MVMLSLGTPNRFFTFTEYLVLLALKKAKTTDFSKQISSIF